MATLTDMLVYLRKRMSLSQQELADKLGMTRSAIGMYETGKREPDLETLEAFADFFNVDMNTLTGRNNYMFHTSSGSHAFSSLPGVIPMPAVNKKPRLGSIACGDPILAEQNIESYDDVPDWIQCDFTLLCKGDSMTGARIFDGDIVCIHAQPTVESGEIAAVLVDGEEATLKRVRFLDDGIALWPENPAYAPMIFIGADAGKVRILGRATHFISTIR